MKRAPWNMMDAVSGGGVLISSRQWRRRACAIDSTSSPRLAHRCAGCALGASLGSTSLRVACERCQSGSPRADAGAALAMRNEELDDAMRGPAGRLRCWSRRLHAIGWPRRSRLSWILLSSLDVDEMRLSGPSCNTDQGVSQLRECLSGKLTTRNESNTM